MLTQFPRWARPLQLPVPIIPAYAFGGITGLVSGQRQPGIMPVRDGP